MGVFYQRAERALITGKKVQTGDNIAVLKEPLVHDFHTRNLGNDLGLGNSFLTFRMALGRVSLIHQVDVTVVAQGNILGMETCTDS